MSSKLNAKLNSELKKRKQANLLRQRQLVDAVYGSHIHIDGKEYINFSSNDYLGLNQTSELIEAQQQAAKKYGVGSGSSPLVTGYSQAHQDLEQYLCELTGHQAAMVFTSGFSANHGLMSALFDKSDVVVADKLIHASLIDGLRHSGAKLKRFKHNSVTDTERLLASNDVTALVTESVFSMDGDCAPLQELSALCKQYNTHLIVDDAHGFGVLGQTLGCAAKKVKIDIQIVTFGKALGCQGAAILGSQQLIDYLSNHCRDYIYSTALSPASAAVALKSIQLAITEPQRQTALIENIAYFRKRAEQLELPILDSSTPIQGIEIGEPEQTLQFANLMKQDGLWVGAIRTPTVPVGTDRLRVTITAQHSRSDIDTCVEALSKNYKQLTQTAIHHGEQMLAKGNGLAEGSDYAS
ncbi:aminotransferase class I/II-fold pyridoxal phosphate-dependent enzyme [Parashewanella tropica]|uniref:aminotransferase class I/II-fold pyridoxal phosphate-dependent enzyme n=1 Tax=Parashewanella tropica TaxID=2547970 RepID=UPI0010593510|nr:8-amino-7-oxononanoate synthase [Parashewanella tropica]